jgi:hypothetical protein
MLIARHGVIVRAGGGEEGAPVRGRESRKTERPAQGQPRLGHFLNRCMPSRHSTDIWR